MTFEECNYKVEEAVFEYDQELLRELTTMGQKITDADLVHPLRTASNR